MINLDEISGGVIEGDADKVIELTRAALDVGVSAKKILDEALIPGIRKVGDLFGAGEYFLPELIVSGEAVSRAVEFLKPILSQANIPLIGKYLIGTVEGDVHDIGKNIVIMMLQGNGWEVTDLGVDVSSEQFCVALEKGDFQIIGLSALLTLTMENMAKTINALKLAGLRDEVKVMVGGAPVTQAYADKIGADGYAPDAVTACEVAARLIDKS